MRQTTSTWRTCGPNSASGADFPGRSGDPTRSRSSRLRASCHDRYSPASLSRLDDLVDDCWSTDRFEEADVGGDGVDDRIYRRLVEQLGSYFGEVLVRSQDARWAEGDDPFVRDTVVEVPADPSKFEMVYGTVSRELDGD